MIDPKCGARGLVVDTGMEVHNIQVSDNVIMVGGDGKAVVLDPSEKGGVWTAQQPSDNDTRLQRIVGHGSYRDTPRPSHVCQVLTWM